MHKKDVAQTEKHLNAIQVAVIPSQLLCHIIHQTHYDIFSGLQYKEREWKENVLTKNLMMDENYWFFI